MCYKWRGIFIFLIFYKKHWTHHRRKYVYDVSNFYLSDFAEDKMKRAVSLKIQSALKA